MVLFTVVSSAKRNQKGEAWQTQKEEMDGRSSRTGEFVAEADTVDGRKEHSVVSARRHTCVDQAGVSKVSVPSRKESTNRVPGVA